MTGLCGCCGAPSIIKSNIDIVDYFELCNPCKEDYDKVAGELYVEFVDDEGYKEEGIPEFWKD